MLVAVGIGLSATIDPDTSGAVGRSAFLCLLVAFLLFSRGGVLSGERLLTVIGVAGLLLRIPLALAHVAVAYWIYGGETDLSGFYTHGVRIGREFLEGRFEEALFGFEYTFAGDLALAVVHRLSALLYFFVGPSAIGMSLASGLVGFLGSLLFLRAYQTEFPSSRETRFLAMCLFLFPGLAFWSSLLGKDSWIYFFLGWVTYSAAQLFKAVRFRHVCGVVISVTFIFLTRAAIGPILVAALGVGILLAMRSRIRDGSPEAILRPAAYVSCAVIAAGMVMLAASAGPRIGVNEPTASPMDDLVALAVHKHVGLAGDLTAGGSSLEARITEPTLFGAIQFLPGGILTFLFRPVIFEAHNPLAFAAAFDGTLLAFLVLWRWRHLLMAARAAVNRPLIAFCWVAFLPLLAGLSFEANFGVIVRHRIMVLPFLFLFLAVPTRQEDSADAPEGQDSSTRPVQVPVM